MILFSHPTGNANVRHAALALHEAGLLGEFWTCIDYREQALLSRILPSALTRQLRRRTNPPQLHPYLRSAPIREVVRLLSARAGLKDLIRHETGRFSVDSIYRALDSRVVKQLSNPRFEAVYAYEDGAAFTFRRAKVLGKSTFYDLPIGYWRAARAILTEEAETKPDWASTLVGNLDSAEKTDRKDEELALSDHILVASSFTKDTLKSAPGITSPVTVIPYGSPPASTFSPPDRTRKSDSPLQVLFVGSLGQRKGLSYLFDACNQLGKSVELTIIGTRPLADCPALDTALAKVRWIKSCPHAKVLEKMAASDVFVFPSLFEGFGLVLLEAMAMGLPIIATPHTAAPDLIDDGIQGFIVPIRDSGAIAERLTLLHEDPDLLKRMSQAALEHSRQFTWERYRNRLGESIHHALASNTCKF